MKFHYSHEIAKFLLTKELVSSLKELADYFEKQEEYSPSRELANKFSLIARKKKLVFKRMKVSYGAAAKVFVFDNKSIVKIGGVSELDNDITFPEMSIPTVVLFEYNKEIDARLLVRVQPKALIDKSSRLLAYDELVDLSSDKVGSDLHEGNVGIYKKKPVVFDW